MARRKQDCDRGEFEFFLHSDLERYRGRYVAILGEKVVASGEDAKSVWEAARRKHPGSHPTLAKLPKEEALVLGFRWK